MVVHEAHNRLRLANRQRRLALATEPAEQEHKRERQVPGRADDLEIREIRLAIGEMTRVDSVETASTIKKDALPRGPLRRREVFHLGGEDDVHSEILPGRVRGGERELPLGVQR